jgi:hypothetical protein
MKYPLSPSAPGDDDDTDTPVDLNQRRPPQPASAGRKGWGSLEAAVAHLAERVRQARQEWDSASTNHRRFLAEKVGAECGELESFFRDFGADMRSYAQGVGDVVDD